MLNPGDVVDVTIERPAAGGRMIARHEGQVVLVAGVIPGERASVRIERSEKRLAFASLAALLEPSSDRREPPSDPACGGLLFAHIGYPRQVALKSEIIVDAFTRIGRIPLERAAGASSNAESMVHVAASPEHDYRMRARFHLRDGRVGFYREGTHEVCDGRESRLLASAAIDAVERVASMLVSAGVRPTTIVVSENVPADERAMHVDLAEDARPAVEALAEAVIAAELTGVSARGPVGPVVRVADPSVGDTLLRLTAGRTMVGQLRRRPSSFFQGNRFLLVRLVTAVLDAVPMDGSVLDLYAGVGLFSVALAATGRTPIVAVEGDRDAAADLKENAAPYASALRATVGRVEDHTRAGGRPADTIVVDPPRTGISREAMEAIAHHGASRVVYVSCDPPTMARDARRLLDAGYRLHSIEGFDLFPNTPHVETLAVFVK
jgi:23S rRNA (uracil1939-C5)-methyltransferase